MSDKQKPETAAPAEVNDEALDQVNGGKTKDFVMTAGFGGGGVYVEDGATVVKHNLGDK